MTITSKYAPIVPVIVLAIVLGCASGSKPVDPAAVQAKVEASEAEFRDLANDTIEDRDRAATFIRLLDERDALIADHAGAVRRYAETMKALNADYDASRDDFERVARQYNSDRRLSQSRFVDLMSRMKAATTDKEWKKLSKFELKELDPRKLAYAPGAP